MTFAHQGLSNSGEPVALPPRLKLRRGFGVGLPSRQPADIFSGRPAPVQSVFAFSRPLVFFWVGALNAPFKITLLLRALGGSVAPSCVSGCVSSFFPPPLSAPPALAGLRFLF